MKIEKDKKAEGKKKKNLEIYEVDSYDDETHPAHTDENDSINLWRFIQTHN